MPGLTIETKAQARRPVQVTAVPVPIIPGAPAHGGARSASNPHPSSTAGSRAVSSRTSSPTRPPISPITPTLGPARLHGVAPPGTAAVPSATTISTTSATTPSPRTLPSYNSSNNATAIAAIPDFALGRPAFTISSQPDQTQNAIPHPPVQVIDFDSNPDVLAVRSAINILQLQRARAAADIQALHRAKEAALEDPEAFVADLASGRIGTEGDPLMNPHADRSDGSDSDDDDDEHEDEDDYEEDGDSDTEIKREEIDTKDHNGDIDMLSTEGSRRTKSKKSAWRKLPKPQTVVRCPPINWSQYAVAGESLDKLHAEQVAAPDPGAPSVLAPRGTYDFKQEERAGGEKPQKLVGIAAPYVPGRDKLGNGKGRGGKR